MKNQIEKAKVTAIYAVPSLLGTGQRCTSLAKQKAAVARATDQYDLEVVAEIEMVGVNGCIMSESKARPAVPEIREMLRMLNDGEIAGIVVSGLDRLPVPYNMAGMELMDGLTEAKARIYTADQVIDLGTQEGRIDGIIRTALPRSDRELWRNRCLAARAMKRKERAAKASEQDSTPGDGTPDSANTLRG